MIVGTATKRPVVAAVGLRDREIVDAGNAQVHEAVFVEVPIFITIAYWLEKRCIRFQS